MPQNLDRPHTTVLYSAWMGALFSAEWGKTKAEEEDEDVWQGGEEGARNGSRNGLKFIAHTQPDSPARPRGCAGAEEVSELLRCGNGTEGGREKR